MQPKPMGLTGVAASVLDANMEHPFLSKRKHPLSFTGRLMGVWFHGLLSV
jgi:hypothetical protein